MAIFDNAGDGVRADSKTSTFDAFFQDAYADQHPSRKQSKPGSSEASKPESPIVVDSPFKISGAEAQKGDQTVELASKRIEQALRDLEQGSNRSQSMIEKDIRDTLRALNSKQIDQISRVGFIVEDAILNNDEISQKTKDAAAIYLRGNDKRSSQEARELINIALREGNVEMFSEAMRDAGAQERKAFLDENGAAKIVAAFDPDEILHAFDFARYGKLDVATQIIDNSGLLNDNEDGIELALKRMSNEERLQYRLGKQLSGETVALSGDETAALAKMTAEQKKDAQGYYDRVHDALDDAANSSEMLKWENMIAVRGGTFVAKLEEHRGVLWNDGVSSILKDIDAMSQGDWADAKQHPERRGELKSMLQSLYKSEESIERILKAYDQKLSPDNFEEAQKTASTDILTKLAAQNSAFNTDEEQVVRDLRDAFAKDPGLRERLVNPTNEADKQYAEQLTTAVMQALGPSMYMTYLPELLEKGRLSIETVTKLDKGLFNDDEMGTYEDLTHAGADEKKRLSDDGSYRQEVLGYLNEKEMQIAICALQQDELHAADKIRAGIVACGGSSRIVEELQALTAAQVEEARREYATKYGAALDADLQAKLSGQDLVEAKRVLSSNLSTEAQADLAKDEYYKTRSGFGAWLADNVWQSGTGFQADDAIDQLTKAEGDANRVFKQVPEEKLVELLDDMRTAVDNHRETKAAAAEIASDVLITAAAVASVIASGGATLPLVAQLALAGALVKVGTKQLLMGADYQPHLSDLLKDAGMGAITGGLTVLGPAEVGAIFKVGNSAASSACKKLLAEKVISVSLKEGAEEALEKGVKKLVVDAFASGARQVDDAVVSKLCEKLVTSELTGVARQTEVNLLTQNISKTLKSELTKETENFFTNAARKELLNAGAGAMGAGGGGMFKGLTEWDSQKRLGDNLTHIFNETGSAAMGGALGASIMSHAFSGISKVVSKVKGASSSSEVAVGADVLNHNEMLTFGKEQFLNNGALKNRDYISAKHVSIAKNEDGQILIMDHSAHGTYVRRTGSEGFVRLEKGVPTKIELGDEVRLGAPDGDLLPMSSQATDALSGAQKTNFERATDLKRTSYDPRLDGVLDQLDFAPGKTATFADLNKRLSKEGTETIHERVEGVACTTGDQETAIVTDKEVLANVYSVRGHDTKIRVPQEFDAQLDEVRALRLAATKESILDGSDSLLLIKLTRIAQDEPKALTTMMKRTFPGQTPDELQAAQHVIEARAKLTAHPQGNCLLPEDIISMLDQTPMAPLSKSVDLFESEIGRTVADGLLGDSRNYYNATRRVRFFGARLADPINGSDMSVSLNGHCTSSDFGATFWHEESHLVPKGWQDIYEKGHKFEASSKYHVSGYAATQACEDYAESRGGVFLVHDGEKFLEMAKNAPVRTALMSREIELGMLAAPNAMHNPNLQKFWNRIDYVNAEVVPLAKKQIMDEVKEKLEKYGEFDRNWSLANADECQAAAEAAFDSVSNALHLLTVIGNESDVAALQTVAKKYYKEARPHFLEGQLKAMRTISLEPKNGVPSEDAYYLPKLNFIDFML